MNGELICEFIGKWIDEKNNPLSGSALFPGGLCWAGA